MKKIPASLVCGLAAMLVTVVSYFTILGSFVLEIIHFVTLAAILLAEAVTILYVWAAKGSPRGIAAAVVTGLMIPFAVILSVVYVISFPTGYATYIGWFLGGEIIVNVIAFILMWFDSRKKEENDQTQAAKSNMLGLRKLVKCILADPAAQPYGAQLKALEEKLHFSNDNVIAEEDENIRLLLLQLQENIADPEFDCPQMLQKIEKAIDVRNIMVSK